MGVKQLFPFVGQAMRKGYICEFEGKNLGVDISCLLYKALYYEDYMDVIQSYVKLLKDNKNFVYMVFDGQPPETKKQECQDREDRRKKIMEKVAALRKEAHGNPDILSEAQRLERSCLTITPEVLKNVKKYLEDQPFVRIVQSPGESDAQLTYLSLNGMVDVVVTEDSDLIVYGCQKIVYKLSPAGSCSVYDRKLLNVPYDFAVFRWMCILAGCDYMKGGLKGMGLVKSKKFFLSSLSPRGPYDERRLRCVLRGLPKVDPKFIEDFVDAERTYLHQQILDPVDGRVKPLYPVTPKATQPQE